MYRPYLSWLASLRGFLIILVFLCHREDLPIHEDAKFVLGRIGVTGFFMASGFLAEQSVMQRNHKQFALNRFLRIYPVAWFLLLCTFVLKWPEYSFSDLFLNLTLFNEFFRVENIIGASWMLSILLTFYIIVCFCKRDFGRYIRQSFWLISLGAVLMGIVRRLTGIPFPTAFCLLQLVGFLGCMNNEGVDGQKKRLFAFEITLLLTSILSYADKSWIYFISYNLGILFFYFFRYYNIQISVLEKISEFGFTLFLGASIPMILLSKIVNIWFLGPYIEILVCFILALLFAWCVTRWIEKPLLSKGKEWEYFLK